MRTPVLSIAASVATLVALLAAPHVARADDTFEAKAEGAQAVHDLADLAWALTATCDHGTATAQRQCKHVRDARVATLSGATLLVDAEPEALHVAPWNAAKKSIELTLSACVRCGGVPVDGKTLYLVGGNAPRVEGGRVKATVLHDGARAFSDEAAAKAWLKSVRHLRVQLLLKVPEKVKWKIDGKEGVLLDVIGYRVVTPCDGAVVVASPPAQAVEADKKRCRAANAEPADLPEGPDSLTQSMVQGAMKPVVDAADGCFERYGVTGTAKLTITIAGDGTVVDVQQTGDFQDTPTGKCIEKAMDKVSFPRTKKARLTIGYPIVLQ